MTEMQFNALVIYIDKVVEQSEHASHEGFLALGKQKKKLHDLLVKPSVNVMF